MNQGIRVASLIQFGRYLGCGVLALMTAGCAGNGSSTTPSSSAGSRIIGLSGSLAFGSVAVGSNATAVLTITNSGDTPLTITGMTVPAGTSAAFTATWTDGTIAAGASQQSTFRFTPPAAQSYSGALTVNGNQTGGTNTIPITATGVAASPTTLALTGTVTDGTSHGILPNITVQIASGTNAGKSVVTDGSGNYTMSGLTAGTFTLSASATGYQTSSQSVTLSANTRVDIVLQRAASPTPSPTPTPTPTPGPTGIQVTAERTDMGSIPGGCAAASFTDAITLTAPAGTAWTADVFATLGDHDGSSSLSATSGTGSAVVTLTLRFNAQGPPTFTCADTRAISSSDIVTFRFAGSTQAITISYNFLQVR